MVPALSYLALVLSYASLPVSGHRAQIFLVMPLSPTNYFHKTTPLLRPVQFGSSQCRGLRWLSIGFRRLNITSFKLSRNRLESTLCNIFTVPRMRFMENCKLKCSEALWLRWWWLNHCATCIQNLIIGCKTDPIKRVGETFTNLTAQVKCGSST